MALGALPSIFRTMQPLIAIFPAILSLALSGGCVELEVLSAESSTDTWPASECREEDPETLYLFYPDCDGDGVFRSSATKACGPVGADLAFDSLDGTDPKGGWSETPGVDPNDEDSNV